MKNNIKIVNSKNSEIASLINRINDFPNNINQVKINRNKIERKLNYLFKKKKLYSIWSDNIKVGYLLKGINKKLIFLDFFSYSHRYLSIADIKNLKYFKNKVFNRSYHLNKLNKNLLSEIKVNPAYLKKKLIKKILILGPHTRNKKIKNKLISNGYKVDLLNNRINLKNVIKKKYDFIISSGYPYKITGDIITKFKNNIINLHATFLPWGKGIGTTFFSFLLFQPIGVSIHFINKKYDMGNIICRIRVKEKENDTTRSYYRRILSKLEKIFIKNSKKIINQNIASKNQKKFNVRPQYFSRDNFESIMRNLPNGYDTKLKDLSIHGAIINHNIKFINYLK